MNIKLIRLNSSDYDRIKEISLDLSNEISAQEVFGVFDTANIFIYEYDNAIRLNDSDITLLLPIVDEVPCLLKKTIGKMKVIAKMFGSENQARVNEQSMFFIKENKILEIS